MKKPRIEKEATNNILTIWYKARLKLRIMEKHQNKYLVTKNLVLVLILFCLCCLAAMIILVYFVTIDQNQKCDESDDVLASSRELPPAPKVDKKLKELEPEQKVEKKLIDMRLPKHLIPKKYKLQLIPFIIPNNFTIKGYAEVSRKSQNMTKCQNPGV